MRSRFWRGCLLLICSPTKTQLRLPTFAYIFIVHLQQQKESVRGKTASFLIHFGWPQKKKKVVLEAGSKRLSSTCSHLDIAELWGSLPTLSELYREVMMNMLNPHDKTLTVKWTVLLQKASFPINGGKISGPTHFYMRRLISEQVGIIDLAPFSLHCQRLWKKLRQNIWSVFKFVASWLLSLEK